jgi:hypothetical protein
MGKDDGFLEKRGGKEKGKSSLYSSAEKSTVMIHQF